MPRWNPARTRIQLKLAIQRTRMLEEKKQALAKRSRAEIAELMRKGRIETARVKTESMIQDDIHVELLELLELYAETLYARFALLELDSAEPDPAIAESLNALVHAAPRTEVRELHVLQEMLLARYGKDVAIAAIENTDGCVPERVARKVAYTMPPSDLVDAYIAEICRTYDVPLPDGWLGQSAGDAEGAQATAAHEENQDGEMDAARSADSGSKERTDTTESAAKSAPAAPDAPREAPPPSAPTAPTSAPHSAPNSASTDWNNLMDRFAALKRR